MRVLELSDQEAAAAYCGKLLARWGAEVLRVESPLRAAPDEALDRYLNGGKRRIALDYREAAGREAIDVLAHECDVLLTDAPAGDVEAHALLALGGDRPRARPHVRASITPFGLGGPYRDYEATPATLLALGGQTWLAGDPGRAPLTFPGNYPYYQAGTFAYTGILSALLGAAAPEGAPVTVEVSVLETLASLHQFTDVKWTHMGVIRGRHGSRWEDLCPTTLLPCKDGWFGLNILANFWESFALMTGRPELIEDPRFATNASRLQHADEVEALIIEAFEGLDRQELFRSGQEQWRVPIGPVLALGEVLEDRHLAEREFWRTIEGDGGLRVPGSPFRFAGEPQPPEHPPATEPEPLPFRWRSEPHVLPRIDARDSTPSMHRPLAGLRVVDLTRIWSGPMATRILADLGAEVIKIEAPTGRGPSRVPAGAGGYYPDRDPGERPWNRQGLTNKLSRNKQSLAIDLKSDEGREAFLRLVAVSDVVIENFSARAMPQLGLGYDRLREANERIIYVAMPAYGLSGPYRDYVGLGPSIEPVTGMNALIGYDAEEPRTSGQAITDAMSGTVAAAAVLTALWRRQQDGRGAFVELSQEEAGIGYFGEQFIRRQLTGEESPRSGNAHPALAPHGVYRCDGDDEWIALAARSEDEWRALDGLAGCGWAADARFATLGARREHREALDAAIEGWTAGWRKHDLMHALQARGVPAGAVQTTPDWLADPHLEARGYFFETDEADAGHFRYDGLPLRFDGDNGIAAWQRAPTFGEHNERVLAELLGYAPEAFEAMTAAGVVVTRPPV